MQSKTLVPIAIAIVVLVLATALIFSFSHKTAMAPVGPLATTSEVTVPATSTAPAVSTPVSTPAPATQPKGAVVTGETVWRAMTPAGWALSFSSQVPWQVSISNDAQGNPSFASLSGSTSAIVVSKDLHIATPSDITPSIATREIAGQSIRVSKYDNPQKGYAYSLSFSLVVKGSTYYFLLQSATTSTKTTDDFISLIK